MMLLFGSVAGFLLLIVGIFYLLKLFSVTLFHIPGFESFYRLIITVIPYVIFFAGYYYLQSKIGAAQKKGAQIAGKILLITGSLVCFASMIMAILELLKLNSPLLDLFNDNTHYSLIVQILFLFFAAAAIATGDAKEKNWIEKGKSS